MEIPPVLVALAYLREGEFPELVRLRIAMLVEGGCDNYALNLANWCVQSSEYAGDVFIRQTQLLLLHKLAKLPEFYNQVRITMFRLLLSNL